MKAGKHLRRGNTNRVTTSAPGSVMILVMMAVVVLTVLGFTILTLSYSEDFNARRERSSLLAFYAAEGGIHEALVRMNLDPSGASNDETEIKWGAGTGNPDSVRDPRMVQGNALDPNPANFSDSSINSWRFWNYDPNWRYSGTSAGGEGNYPGATSTQQANLGLAGRAFTYASASARALPSGSSYTVQVVPHVRNIAGTWTFVNERGAAAAANYSYYKATSTGTYGGQSASAQVIVKKFYLTAAGPGALTAKGNVNVGGNSTVTKGDPGDENPSGIAVQSAGIGSSSGSGTVIGTTLSSTPFPAFQSVFGVTQSDMQTMATITGTYTANTTTNPAAVPSGTVGQVIWLTAKASGVNTNITLTGGGSSGYTLGSPTQPVIMMVDGDLTLNSVTIYGVIYVTGAFKNQGNSQIKGAVLVEGTADTDVLGTGSGGGTKIAYSKSVLNMLNNNPAWYPFRSLMGTWKMSRG